MGTTVNKALFTIVVTGTASQTVRNSDVLCVLLAAFSIQSVAAGKQVLRAERCA